MRSWVLQEHREVYNKIVFIFFPVGAKLKKMTIPNFMEIFISFDDLFYYYNKNFHKAMEQKGRKDFDQFESWFEYKFQDCLLPLMPCGNVTAN